MPYNPLTVANRIISLAAEQGRTLTPMQIIKLTYISHGFSLAIHKRPLINESVEAWRYGPVIPSLYQKLKKFGSSAVPGPQAPGIFGREETLSPDDDALIAAVFAKYGKFSGTQLSHLTHRAGTPWYETYKPGEFGVDMDDKQIQIHYATLLNDGRANRTGHPGPNS